MQCLSSRHLYQRYLPLSVSIGICSGDVPHAVTKTELTAFANGSGTEPHEVDSTITVANYHRDPHLFVRVSHSMSPPPQLSKSTVNTPIQSRRSRQKSMANTHSDSAGIIRPMPKHTQAYARDLIFRIGRAVPSPTPCPSTMTSTPPKLELVPLKRTTIVRRSVRLWHRSGFSIAARQGFGHKI